ncbi:MAG TPA: ShlB/FhaC/HecB family hemolysin secretion/activation protein [Marinagarivorans sp.]
MLALLISASSLWAQSLTVLTDDTRLKVTLFSLLDEDMAQKDSHVSPKLPMPELLAQLTRERDRFGEMMSLDELHQVADALTLYVRNKGYVFHSVYLPPQEVEHGFVTLRLQKGKLGSVHVINNTSLPDRRFSAVFSDLLGDILYAPDVEDRVQALKAQGGFDVFAFYSRGVEPGQARLNLKVSESRQRALAVSLDNYGSASSGEQRLIGQYSEFQLTGRHDRLSLAVLHGVDGVANTYGSVAYNLPFGGLRYAWDISASNNQFEVGDRYAALGLEGDAINLRTGITRHMRFHPKHRSRIRFGIYEKRTSLDALGNTTVQKEQSQALNLRWSKDRQWPESGTLFNRVIEASHGQFEVEGVPDGKFNKLNVSGFWLTRYASGRARNLVQLNVQGQASDTALPSVEGFSLTGANGVRGFEAGGFNADSAVLASLEWRFPSLWPGTAEQRWRLEPILLADWATGRKEGLGDSLATKATYASAGVGLRMSWGQHVAAQLTASNALKGDLNGTEVDSDGQVLFEIRWY